MHSVFSPFVTANSILRIISVYFSFLVFTDHCETKATSSNERNTSTGNVRYAEEFYEATDVMYRVKHKASLFYG